MAIPHAAPGQVVDILARGSQLPSAVSCALFKTDELEVMRLVLPAGKTLPPHKVAGELTIQCLEGRIEFTAQGRAQVLHAGQLVHLSGEVSHALAAIEDACALVTIVLKK